MIEIQIKTRGALNKDSILSVNKTNSSCVKEQKTIQSGFNYVSEQTVTKYKTAYEENTHCRTQKTITVPELKNRIHKGQKTVLSVNSDDVLEACFGWNTINKICDIDVSAFLIGDNGKVLGDDWFVFYGCTLSPDKSVEFISDSSFDREKIRVNLKKLDKRVQKIVFVLTINEALENHFNFGMVKDAYIRIIKNINSQNELVSFLMTEYYTNVISMMIGELYIHNGTWKFNAIGNGVAKDLAGLCELYGVNVDS